MNYEQKYKEALERAKTLYENANGMILKKLVEQVFPELCESEDERIRYEILAYIGSEQDIDLDTYNKWCSWLEKQDPKKHEEELEKAYKTADEVQYKRGYEDAIKEIEKQGAQKPVDKVKPKFKIGDWINGYYTNYKVLSVNNNGYVVEDVDGNKINILFENEKFHHLWTIKDAKDGDVLVTENKNIFIFKSISDCTIYDYCGLYHGEFMGFSASVNGSTATQLPTDYVPATKEQRDLLFQKMKENGYEFDVEKKELKPIFDIEIPYGAKDSELQEVCYNIPEGFHAEIEGNKVIIKKGEKKSNWSEEDEKKFRDVIRLVEQGATVQSIRDHYTNWLKSLKGRYTWKPSDEQMETLYKYAEQNNYDGSVLTSLYNELKKLREE